MLTRTEIQSLLSKLATELGFCEVEEDFGDLQTNDIDEFTKAIFSAEGLDPEWGGGDLYKQVRQRVDAAFEKHDKAKELAEIVATLN